MVSKSNNLRKRYNVCTPMQISLVKVAHPKYICRMYSDHSAASPAKALLALVLPFGSLVSASAQIQHAPPRRPRTTASVNEHNLACHENRLTQLNGPDETYSYVIRDGRHNNRPEPASFTLKAGESKIVETAAEAPFTLVPDSVLSWSAAPVEAARYPRGTTRPLVFTYVESGSGITMVNQTGNSPAGQSAVTAGPPANQRELSLRVDPNCSTATQVRGNPEIYEGRNAFVPENPEPLSKLAIARFLELLPTLAEHATPVMAGLAATYEALHPTEVDQGETEGLRRFMDSTRKACPAGLPTLIFSYERFPSIAAHIATAQFQHPEWQILTISRDDPKVVEQRRRQACSDVVRDNFKPLTCDEYPFRSTAEGGTGASVWPVPGLEQSKQGADIQNFYNNEKGTRKPDGTKFCIALSP